MLIVDETISEILQRTKTKRLLTKAAYHNLPPFRRRGCRGALAVWLRDHHIFSPPFPAAAEVEQLLAARLPGCWLNHYPHLRKSLLQDVIFKQDILEAPQQALRTIYLHAESKVIA